jgi:uncharacterized membrane protein YfcA
VIKWFLDNSLEVALAYLRVLTLTLPLAALACFVASIWAREDGAWWRLLVTGGLLAFIGACAGVMSFYLYGNEDWRPKRGDAER